ncbi:MAG: M24 family metallopeptidase [Fuerstiella sp.]
MSSDFKEDQRPRRLLVQDESRLRDVEEKHQKVRELLAGSGADALLLQDPANIAWFTAGADLFRFAGEDVTTSVFVTADARLFATSSVDSAQIFDREVFGLGFQLKQREWFQPHEELVADLCRGRKVVSDLGAIGTKLVKEKLRAIRLPLSELEVERLRLLSKVAVHAVEATAHGLKPGVTESEVAGEVSHRLVKRTVAAVRLQVCADGRNERYRHWAFGEHLIQNYVTITCVARRWGLHVGVTRTVCFDTVPGELWKAYQRCLLLHATGLYFSRHNETLGGVWKKVHRIYEKFGIPFEWQQADQADVLGYRPSERRLVPESDFLLDGPVPLFWHSSVGPAMIGDSILCRDGVNETLTRSESWPELPVQVKGHDVMCPGILLRRTSRTSLESTPADATSPEDVDAMVGGEHGDLRGSASGDVSVACPDHPEEALPQRLDSVWELELPPARAVWEEDDSPYPEESVLE